MAENQIACRDAVRPDVVLRRRTGRRMFLLAECKKSSFGLESTTSEQARAYLLITGPDFGDVMGLTTAEHPDSAVVYLIPWQQCAALEDTLHSLEQEMFRDRVPHGHAYFLGLKGDDATIALVVVDKTAMGLSLNVRSPVTVLKAEPGTDPRPLYFIPYDPGIDQNPEERAFCRRILLERVHASLLSRIGRAALSTDRTFTTDDLLSDATFEMYKLWVDSEARKHVRRLAFELLAKIRQSLPKEDREMLNFVDGDGWVLHITTSEGKERLLSYISRFRVDGFQPSDPRQIALIDVDYKENQAS
ncbi:MAG: hypothetical protein QUS33_01715 [Dehalococcoidia bacterium]|nr:hypothetical protein [Dehalococcoidia bacterium]